MTTVLFLLRSVEIGISVGDLDLLTIGMVLDMWTEKANDDVNVWLVRVSLIGFRNRYLVV